jgi:hypothetical protein
LSQKPSHLDFPARESISLTQARFLATFGCSSGNPGVLLLPQSAFQLAKLMDGTAQILDQGAIAAAEVGKGGK